MARRLKLNQVAADLSAAARRLEQAQPEDYIPDYDHRRQTLAELKQTRQVLAVKKYRLESRCQAEPSPAAELEPAATPADRQIRDCDG